MADIEAEGKSLVPQMTAHDADVVITSAVGRFERVFILGYTKDGQIDAFGSLNFPNEQIVFALERFKHKIMMGDYGQPEDML